MFGDVGVRRSAQRRASAPRGKATAVRGNLDGRRPGRNGQL